MMQQYLRRVTRILGGSGDSSNGLGVCGFASEVHGHIFKCGSHSTSTYTFCRYMHYTCNLQYILLSVVTYMKLYLIIFISNYLFPFGGTGMARGSIETKE